eukprot:4129531-Pleurochrysis_carterae.AAC.1
MFDACTGDGHLNQTLHIPLVIAHTSSVVRRQLGMCVLPRVNQVRERHNFESGWKKGTRGREGESDGGWRRKGEECGSGGRDTSERGGRGGCWRSGVQSCARSAGARRASNSVVAA